MARDWTPVLRGETYCSPACGAGCTVKAYNEAREQAERLAEQMGPGWKAVVHENLRWHYRVTNGELALYEYLKESPVGYSLFCNGTPQFVLKGNDPYELVQRAMLERVAWINTQTERVGHLAVVMSELPKP